MKQHSSDELAEFCPEHDAACGTSHDPMDAGCCSASVMNKKALVCSR